ncbi:MAG: type II secretion system F family protein [Euryarchaeota archaeon]|nr:type II secretion system F family protein [Euryarchaeota archaeon]
MPEKKDKKGEMLTYISFGIGGAIMAMGIGMYLLKMPPIGGVIIYLDLIIVGLSVLLAIPGIYDFMATRRVKKIEERLPDFLRDLAEAGRFGMTLAEAIVVASTGRYGALSDEIKRMAAKIEWGVPVNEALESFVERVNTPLINRMVAIMIKANQAGGNVADVLSMVAHSAKETQLMEKERSIEMSTYGFVLVTSFFVFLATIIILNTSFLPQMGKAGRAVAESLAHSAVTNIPVQIAYQTIPTIRFMFVLATIMHGVGDGIMIGLLRDGKVKGGMLFGFALLISGYLILRLSGAV